MDHLLCTTLPETAAMTTRDGVRLITIQLHRAGWVVNHKRVARIRREDNLL
jgi:hypothetical protein